MKHIFLFFALCSTLLVQAQVYCGTEQSPEFMNYYYSKDMSYLDHAGSRDVNSIIYVPIQYHIVGTDAGAGYYPVKDLLAVHCLLNQRYTRSQIQFYMYAPPHYIRKTRYYNMSDANVDRDMKNENNIADVCNVYIVQDARSSGVTVCGYATFPGFGRQGIVVAKSCSDATSSTLAHEMGHFLGLPHTFSGWEGRDPFVDAATSTDERVDGSNCSTRGDRFCDTPADFISDRWSCPYTGAKTDFNGQLYRTVLDGTYFMSYSNDACQNKFSPLQEAEMYEVRTVNRSGMDRYTVPSVITPPATTAISPAASATSVAPFTSLTWNSSPGATYYHVIMSTSSGFTFNVIVDTILADTSYNLYNAAVSTTYYWKVLPITLGACCGTYTPTRSFTTSAMNAEVVLTSITCPGGADGAISVTPSGGTSPYTYLWSTSEVFSSITDLVAGTYSLTVTDLMGRIMRAEIAIPDGPAINIVISPTYIDQITAFPTGGNGGPYTYLWSNGVTTAQNSPAVGAVTVTVTDSRGCTATKSIDYTSVEAIQETSSVEVYPNPSSGENAVIRISTEQTDDAKITIYNVNGMLLHEMNAQLAEGDNTFILPVKAYSRGIYIVKVQSEAIRKNIRLSVQ